ncbi:MAG: glycoside hydrolase family 57 protein [Bryobacteraceae bacterium]
MPQIYLCFLWHMHQPFYKDLISGEYHLPWTRLHALKDYYGMARILEGFPAIRQTFNLVPSMMVQVDEYAKGIAIDPYLNAALKPAEDLTAAEEAFLLLQSFHADPQRLIYRYPRYGELFDIWQGAHLNVDRARQLYGAQAFRDLQVLSQLTWFDEEFLTIDPGVVELVKKGRGFSLDDQAFIGRKQREILGLVLPEYRKLAATGQIEISTTPYYHPILPLLCDSNIAGISHPGVPLPSRFRYPEDARKQLDMAHEFVKRDLGTAPVGLWPSEGSVSDEVLGIAADAGFEWAATDNGVLDRTLGRGAGVDEIYRPYIWQRDGRSMRMVFRDHFLSDLIGFVYSRMDATQAAEDFLRRIRENCQGMLSRGESPLVPIILDGENAWEYYHLNGRPFLAELYRLISADRQMEAITMREAIQRIEPRPLDHIFPGSWISANFDVWIGAEEDNHAWEYLLRARQTYDQTSPGASEEKRKLAYEELLIAEGSDWCWWYGPEHDTANRVEFDQLYRNHLANVYRALGLQPPEELSRPILKTSGGEFRLEPTGFLHPHIDGSISSYFEWLGAGVYRLDDRSGAMHGRRSPVHELHYGTDGKSLFVRLDFHEQTSEALANLEIRLNVRTDSGETAGTVGRFQGERDIGFVASAECKDCVSAFRNILEIGVPLPSSGAFQLSLWIDGLPLSALPRHGWLEIGTAPLAEWMA